MSLTQAPKASNELQHNRQRRHPHPEAKTSQIKVPFKHHLVVIR